MSSAVAVQLADQFAAYPVETQGALLRIGDVLAGMSWTDLRAAAELAAALRRDVSGPAVVLTELLAAVGAAARRESLRRMGVDFAAFYAGAEHG